MVQIKNKLYELLDSNEPNRVEFYEILRYELDHKIYYYGDHYKNSPEGKDTFFLYIKKTLLDMAIASYVFIRSGSQHISFNTNVLSSAYFNIRDHFNDTQINISRPPWVYNSNSGNIFNYKLYIQTRKIKRKLKSGNFNELISENFYNDLLLFRKLFKEFVVQNKIKALFLPADVGFFEKVSINIFKELNLPSFLFIHGLPAGYNSIDNNRTNYLVVWGEAIKSNFIVSGISPDKIFVSGHPLYKYNETVSLRFDFSDILIITKSLPGTQMSDCYVLRDRSNLIYYLISLKPILQKLGIKSVRFRPHPSENVAWYLKFLDNEFFLPDTSNLISSINQSSLIIGPTSTVFIESLIHGVNYVVYEPILSSGNGLDGNEVVPPFNGQDKKVPVAKNIEELESILLNKTQVDLSVIKDYVSSKFNSQDVIKSIP